MQGRATTSVERKIPLTTLTGVSLSSLRDDWVVSISLLSAAASANDSRQALHVQGVEEDPVISCPLKTELVTQLAQQMRGSLNVNIGPQYVDPYPVMNCTDARLRLQSRLPEEER